MPTHDVYATLPHALMGKKDAFFEIYQDGKKFGTITISKGSIEWYPKNKRKPLQLSWTDFDRMFKENCK